RSSAEPHLGRPARRARGDLALLVAGAVVGADVRPPLAVVGGDGVGVPVDLADVVGRRAVTGAVLPEPEGSRPGRVGEHAGLEGLRGQVRAGHVDADGQLVHLVVDQVHREGRLVVADRLVGGVGDRLRGGTNPSRGLTPKAWLANSGFQSCPTMSLSVSAVPTMMNS